MRRNGRRSRAQRAREIADRLLLRIERMPRKDAASLRRIRREVSAELADETGELVIQVALRLLAHDVPGRSVVAYELLRCHPRARDAIRAVELRRIGGTMSSWGDVDAFACILAGPAWRQGLVADAEIHRWARSKDLWWRRAALVSTVPLNVRARGGEGEPERTLAVCERLASDREDLVVKALSWALRALAVRDPKAVRRFLRTHEYELAPRVVREVESKLRTGLKNPRRPKRK